MLLDPVRPAPSPSTSGGPRRPLLAPGRAVRVRTSTGEVPGLVTTRVDRLPDVVYYVLLEGGEERRVTAEDVRPTRTPATAR